jgi:hypothetical protein
MKIPEEKPRTIEVVDQEYTNHAALAGHKLKQAQDLKEESDRLSEEAAKHLATMGSLGKEARQLKAGQPGQVAPAALAAVGDSA